MKMFAQLSNLYNKLMTSKLHLDEFLPIVDYFHRQYFWSGEEGETKKFLRVTLFIIIWLSSIF